MATLAPGAAIGGSIGGVTPGISAATISGFIGSAIGSVVETWIVSWLALTQQIKDPPMHSHRQRAKTQAPQPLTRLFIHRFYIMVASACASVSI